MSGGKPDAKVDPFRGEISKLYVMLKSYANVFVLRMANWASQMLVPIRLMQVIVHPLSNLQDIFLLLFVTLVDDDTEESCTPIKEPLGKFNCPC